jgi:hypothetical protein
MKKETRLTKLEMDNDLYETIRAITDKDGFLTASFSDIPNGVEVSIGDVSDLDDAEDLEMNLEEWFYEIWGDESIFLTSPSVHISFSTSNNKLYADVSGSHDPIEQKEIEWDTSSLMKIIGTCTNSKDIFLDEENNEYKWNLSFKMEGSKDSNISDLEIVDESTTKRIELTSNNKSKLEEQIKKKVHEWFSKHLKSLYYKELSCYPTYSLEFDGYDCQSNVFLSQEFKIEPHNEED